MADKESTLAIVIRTVDKATAGLRAINERIKMLGLLAAPLQLVGERLGALGKEAGVPRLASAFKGIGSATKGLFDKLKGDILGLGVGVSVVTAGLMRMVDQFAGLADKSDRMGVTADFLAAMRYATEKSGASVDELDSGMDSFFKNLGLARANTGPLVAFLSKVSPALLSQLKATKSNEQAFRLMADAMAKVTDPAKRLALAEKTGLGAALAPLLQRGSAGLNELQGAYVSIAGSQEDAAAAASEVDAAMKDLGAATQGVKAALIAGLGPALKEIVAQLKDWLVGNRDDIKAWAADFGKKLPGAISSVAGAIKSTLSTVNAIISAVGGFKTVAVALGAVLVGPLVSSIYTFSAALLTTPVGWIVTGIGLIALGAYQLIKHWDSVSAFFGDLWDGIKGAFSSAWSYINGYFLNFTPLGLLIKNWEPVKAFFSGLWERIVGVFEWAWSKIKWIVDKVLGAVDRVRDGAAWLRDHIPFLGDDDQPLAAVAQQAVSASARGGMTEARVAVDFANAPRGMRAAVDPRSTAAVDLSVGHNMLPGAL